MTTQLTPKTRTMWFTPRLWLLCTFVPILALSAACQKAPNAEAPEAVEKLTSKAALTRVVEAACGQCLFGLSEPAGCDLAVRIDGQAHFVDGSHIDDHGDAHAKRGMCNVIRHAEVQGQVKDKRFVATHFKLVD